MWLYIHGNNNNFWFFSFYGPKIRCTKRKSWNKKLYYSCPASDAQYLCDNAKAKCLLLMWVSCICIGAAGWSKSCVNFESTESPTSLCWNLIYKGLAFRFFSKSKVFIKNVLQISEMFNTNDYRIKAIDQSWVWGYELQFFNHCP